VTPAVLPGIVLSKSEAVAVVAREHAFCRHGFGLGRCAFGGEKRSAGAFSRGVFSSLQYDFARLS